MATTSNHYDVIIVGTDVAGLVLATLLARSGRRILLLPQGPIEGVVRVAGRSYDLDPAPLLHLPSPVVGRVFEGYGALAQLKRETRRIEGHVHWAIEHTRLDTRDHGTELVREATREWPQDPVADGWDLCQRWAIATSERFDEILREASTLSGDAFWARRAVARIAAELPGPEVDPFEPLPAAHPLRSTIDALASWTAHLSPDRLGLAAGLRLAHLWSQGPLDRSGGIAGLRQLLLQRVVGTYADIKPSLRVGEILVRRGRVAGVSLLGKRDRYGCDDLVIAGNPTRLLVDVLPAGDAPRLLSGTLAAIRPASRRYVLHLEIDERGLPPGLTGIVLRPGHGEDPAAAAAGIGHTFVRQRASADEGIRTVSIVRIVHPEDPLLDTRETILDELHRDGILPFARRWIRRLHSPHDGREATDGLGRPIADVSPGTEMRLEMDPLWGGAPASLGFGLLPHATGIGRLWIAGKTNFPGLGLEGEFLAASNVAAAMNKPSGIRGLFAR